jgi:hypothetical protein
MWILNRSNIIITYLVELVVVLAWGCVCWVEVRVTVGLSLLLRLLLYILLDCAAPSDKVDSGTCHGKGWGVGWQTTHKNVG